MYGQCGSSYLVLGGYCALTCGRCGGAAPPALEVAAASERPNGGRRLAAAIA